MKMRMESRFRKIAMDEPAAYEILVQGPIGEDWEDWFESMQVSHLGSIDYSDSKVQRETLLSGTLPDQAALQGLLQRLYNFQLPIIRVILMESEESDNVIANG